MARANRWNKAREITLPYCGQAVLVRGTEPLELTAVGVNLDRMQQAAARLTEAATTSPDAVEPGAVAPVLSNLDRALTVLLVRPRAVLTEAEVADDEAQVWVGDLVLIDKLAIVLAAAGGEEAAAQAETFPDGAGGAPAGVEPVPDGADVRPAPERPAGAAGRRARAAA